MHSTKRTSRKSEGEGTVYSINHKKEGNESQDRTVSSTGNLGTEGARRSQVKRAEIHGVTGKNDFSHKRKEQEKGHNAFTKAKAKEPETYRRDK